MLEEIADAIEGKPIKVKLTPDVVSLAFLERVLQACSPQSPRRFSAFHVDSFIPCTVKSTYSRLLCQRDRDAIFDRAEQTDESINQNLPGINGTWNMHAAVEAQSGRTAFRGLNLCAGHLAGEARHHLC
jgi:hypothetical protein